MSTTPQWELAVEEIMERYGKLTLSNAKVKDNGFWKNLEKTLKLTGEKYLSLALQQERQNQKFKSDEMLLDIEGFLESERERVVEEKKGLLRKDGGPTLSAFSFINRMRDKLQSLDQPKKE